ncbi:hypothetical protein FLL45_01660 [Aliikangiella marina]|uniref:GNAT family N-acetyltransferase n=1 Tax=Aliikangiella marina TaxID=1712262 RepID=A0A545THI5_9GAMM|nr:hypothetical protein [Aliikangiella marina]TQV76693.1 hypothetical protein FLL45_01660 [Aliikangiella marina]
MDWELTKISTGDELSQIKDTWLNEIDDSDFLEYLEHRIFMTCERIVERDDPASLWVLKKNGAPTALVELSDASRGRDPSYKFLTLHLEPPLIIREKDDISRDILEDIVETINYAIVKSFGEAQNSKDCKLKVFGSTELLNQGLFPALILANDPKKTGMTLKRQAGWLIIDRA